MRERVMRGLAEAQPDGTLCAGSTSHRVSSLEPFSAGSIGHCVPAPFRACLRGGGVPVGRSPIGRENWNGASYEI
jgi:hypothetical protein